MSGLSIFIIAILILIIGFNAYNKRKNETAIVELEEAIRQKLASITVVSTPEITGKKIRSVIGAVSGKSKTEATSRLEFDRAEKEAMLAIIENAIALGANAIVDLKATTSSYQMQGSKWQTSIAMYTGTAVIVD